MNDSLTRIVLVVMLVSAGLYCWQQHEALQASSSILDELAYREKLMREARATEMDFNRRLMHQDPRLLNFIARARGYLLPGEADWWVVEQHNALRWPEIWGTMEPGDNR